MQRAASRGNVQFPACKFSKSSFGGVGSCYVDHQHEREHAGGQLHSFNRGKQVVETQMLL
jgi:hypothetical protein